jgi:hypothetical protein
MPRPVKSAARSNPAAMANGAPHALTANYVYYRDIFETDSNTSAAWTSGGVNALQIGAEVVT